MSKRILATFVVLVVLALAAAGVALIWYADRHLTIDRRVEVLATAAANVVGIILGAALGYHFAMRQADRQREQDLQRQRVANTFEMAREFESPDMVRARCDADKLFVPRDGSEPKYLRHLYETTPVEHTMPIFQVIHFYDRLTRLYEYGQIDSQLAKAIFGEVYQWWYEFYLIYQCEYTRNEKECWENWIRRLDWLLPEGYQDRKLKRQPVAAAAEKGPADLTPSGGDRENERAPATT